MEHMVMSYFHGNFLPINSHIEDFDGLRLYVLNGKKAIVTVRREIAILLGGWRIHLFYIKIPKFWKDWSFFKRHVHTIISSMDV